MKIRTDKRKSGFSLVEILLTMVLILCLAAASVFTFTAMYRSANLDEGYDRFQSLIRFAQAEAATTGHKIQLQFVSPTADSAPSEDEKAELRKIKVVWEADLLNAPGVFMEYTNKAWSEQMVNELVGVQKVQSIQSPTVPSQSASALSALSSSSSETPAPEEFPSITFYPDGSCDSAEIVLASRNSEDERRVEVRLSGILGSVSSRTVSSDQIDNNQADDLEQEYSDLFESSEPVTTTSETAPEPVF